MRLGMKERCLINNNRNMSVVFFTHVQNAAPAGASAPIQKPLHIPHVIRVFVRAFVLHVAANTQGGHLLCHKA